MTDPMNLERYLWGITAGGGAIRHLADPTPVLYSICGRILVPTENLSAEMMSEAEQYRWCGRCLMFAEYRQSAHSPAIKSHGSRENQENDSN